MWALRNIESHILGGCLYDMETGREFFDRSIRYTGGILQQLSA